MTAPLGRLTRLLGSATIVAMLTAGAALAEDQIKAVVAFPPNVAFAQSFQKFVDLVNERGKGVVGITIAGGPEVFPPNQQVDAVKRGIVDMQYGPATYYLGTLPEAYAFVGATVSAMDARQNGGFAAMQEAFSKKQGVRLIANPDSEIDFHIYTVAEPKRTPEGGVDLTGQRIRALPIYNAFFESLGAVPVSVPVADVYTGLERNTFDGAGWPIVGIKDLGWDKFLRYRIDPGFFNGDLAIIMNEASYEKLSPEAKAVIDQAAIDFEKMSAEAFATIITDTDKTVRDEGMTVVALEGDAAKAYLDKAFDSSWQALKDSGSEYYDRLRAGYYNR